MPDCVAEYHIFRQLILSENAGTQFYCVICLLRVQKDRSGTITTFEEQEVISYEDEED
jgi:phosphoribosylformylglycinamidine (FGAM) synthase-like amidotransferase family enzyme